MPVKFNLMRFFRKNHSIIIPIFILFLFSTSAKADEQSERSEIHDIIKRADSLMSVQEIDSALVIGSKALSQARDIFGENDTTMARIYHRLGVYNYLLANYDDAESDWQLALDIRKSVLGERHPDVAIILNNLANLYWNMGRYDDSESMYRHAIDIWAEALGPEHPDNALSIDGLATLYWSEGRYAEAESLFLEALEIREKAYGPNHEEVATTLNNLAILYDDQGKYDKTEKMYLRALDIWEKTLGENHPNVATTLNNLAILYFLRGMYSKVEEYHKRALDIRIKAFGENHPDVAYSYNNLAVLYWAQNRRDEAERLYRKAIDIWQEIDPEHPEYARSLSNLADMLRDRGQFDSALVMMNEALKIRENTLGEDHPDVALSLDNLVNLNMDRGQYEQALDFNDRAIEIRKDAFGIDHPALAWNLNTKARIYDFLGRYSEALPLFKRALVIRESVFSSEHPDVVESQLDLARLYASMGLIDSSNVLYSKALENRQYFIDNVFSHASENQKLRYINSYPLLDYSILSFALKANSHKSINTAFKMILSGKASVIDAVSAEKNIAVCANDDYLGNLMADRSEVVKEIANLSIAGMTFRDEETYHEDLSNLYGQKDSIEAELSQACVELNVNNILQPFDIVDIADALPEKYVLLEYVKFKPYEFDSIPQTGKEYGLYKYMVFALKSDGEVSAFDLGDAAVIDSLIKLSRELIYQAGNDIYTTGDNILVRRLNEATDRLYDLLFRPVETILTDERNILISADGQLNLIPFEILTMDNGSYLVEEYSLSYLSSGRDLLKFQKKRKYDNNAIIIANPDYDYSPDSLTRERGLNLDVNKSLMYSYQPQRSGGDCFKRKFDPIPYTKTEADKIERIMKDPGGLTVTEFYGGDAREINIKELSYSPRIIHMATHGFFCGDTTGTLENPLLRSGLAMSGANITMDDPAKSYGNDDGFLTALEVSALNLDNTELVVLSACETGIGDIQIGEGVYGLRRAFQYAGADAIIFSLWKVPDKETSELMAGFYSNWLSGQSKGEALRESVLHSLNSRRQKYGAAHPYFWGAFILQGDID